MHTHAYVLYVLIKTEKYLNKNVFVISNFEKNVLFYEDVFVVHKKTLRDFKITLDFLKIDLYDIQCF